jgi:hypothetical protein
MGWILVRPELRKRMTCAVAVLLLAPVVFLAVAAQAAAAVPELGHCIPANAEHHGVYSDAACKKKSSRRARYAWVGGPGSANAFSGSFQSNTFTVCQPECKRKAPGANFIVCGSGVSDGKYTAAKTETAMIRLTGCHDVKPLLPNGERDPGDGKPCQSQGANAGEINTESFTGELVINGTVGRKPAAAWAIVPAGGTPFTTFECGAPGAGTQVSIEFGSLLDIVTPRDRPPATAFQVSFEPVGTAAVVSGGHRYVLNTTWVSPAEVITESVSNAEALEIKARPS